MSVVNCLGRKLPPIFTVLSGDITALGLFNNPETPSVVWEYKKEDVRSEKATPNIILLKYFLNLIQISM